MERIPFGIDRLDDTIGGGAPEGSVVLLSGEAGAGAREFMYTAAVMNGLAKTDQGSFDLHYGDVASEAGLPEEIYYLSVTNEEDQLRSSIAMSMDEELVAAGLEAVSFGSLANNYFHLSPVPRQWYAGEAENITSLRERSSERKDLLTALADRVTERAQDGLVIIDSISDLVTAADDDIDWSDINSLVRGLQKAAHRWDGLVLLHANPATLTDIQHGQLVDACNGTIEFRWATGGSTRARTLVIQDFAGVLSRLEAENIVQFETDLGEAGFDISDVRKIR